MAKPPGVKDVGNYRFFIFTGSPKTVNVTVTTSPMCIPESLEASDNTKGKRRYGNVMWDPRVCRGVYVPSSSSTNHLSSSVRCDKLCGDDGLPQKRNLVLRPSNVNVKPARSTLEVRSRRSGHTHAKEIGGRRLTNKVSKIRSSTPPPVEGRLHVICQTNDFSELLEDEVSPDNDRAVQTEDFFDDPIPVPPPGHLHLVSTSSQCAAEKEAQCFPWDIVDMDAAMRPLSENLATAIIERALIDVMDEFELHSLVKQKLRHMQKVNDEKIRMENVRKNLVKAQKQCEIDKARQEFEKEYEAHHLLAIINFSSNYLLDFVESSKERIEESFLDQEARDPVGHLIGPWLNELVKKEIQRRYNCQMLRDGIIHRLRTCEQENDTFCRPPPRPPTNSVVSFHQPNSLEYDEYEGEFEQEQFYDTVGNPTGVDLLWRTDNQVFDDDLEDKSIQFFDDSTEPEQSDNLNDTD